MTRFPVDGTGRLSTEVEHPTAALTGPAGGDLAGSFPNPTVAARVAVLNEPTLSGSLAEVNLMDPRWGVVGDGVTDDWAAITSVIEAIGGWAGNDGSVDAPGGTTIRVPGFIPATGQSRKYRLSKPLRLTRAVELVGEGNGQYTGAVFLPDPGVHGIIVTSEYSRNIAGHFGFANRSILRNFHIEGQASGRRRVITDGVIAGGSPSVLTSATANFTADDVGLGLIENTWTAGGTQPAQVLWAGTYIASVTNSTTVQLSLSAMGAGTGLKLVIGGGCGLISETQFRASDLTVGGAFGGHGILIQAGVPNSNANGWMLDNPAVSGALLDGIHVAGNDGNAGTCLNANIGTCGEAGVRDESFLGNTWVQPQVASCTSAYVVGSAGDGGTTNVSLLLNPYTEGGLSSYLGQYVMAIGSAPTFTGPGCAINFFGNSGGGGNIYLQVRSAGAPLLGWSSSMPGESGMQGSVVFKNNMIEAGSGGSKYMQVGWAWDNTGNVWREMRCLTGN